jgi:hypothetical protein
MPTSYFTKHYISIFLISLYLIGSDSECFLILTVRIKFILFSTVDTVYVLKCSRNLMIPLA